MNTIHPFGDNSGLNSGLPAGGPICHVPERSVAPRCRTAIALQTMLSICLLIGPLSLVTGRADSEVHSSAVFSLQLELPIAQQRRPLFLVFPCLWTDSLYWQSVCQLLYDSIAQPQQRKRR